MDDTRADDIADILADMLASTVGGARERWLTLIGPVRALPIAMNARCNWSVSPIATGDDLHAITRAIEMVRFEHPYVIG